MKKIIIILTFISFIYLFSHQDEVIIPNDALRFRIIANSNSISDQAMKKQIKNDLATNVIPQILTNSLSETRQNIQNNLPLIESTIAKYNIPFEVNYGQNQFPNKTYKGLKYEAGTYESLVITLGRGIGDNWWCVLYPPLCLIDEDDNNMNQVTYKSYIQEIINTYMS